MQYISVSKKNPIGTQTLYMVKEVAPITTVNNSVTKPEKREAMPLSAPVSLDNRKKIILVF